jgi:hypothetical protein
MTKDEFPHFLQRLAQNIVGKISNQALSRLEYIASPL